MEKPALFWCAIATVLCSLFGVVIGITTAALGLPIELIVFFSLCPLLVLGLVVFM